MDIKANRICLIDGKWRIPDEKKEQKFTVRASASFNIPQDVADDLKNAVLGFSMPDRADIIPEYVLESFGIEKGEPGWKDKFCALQGEKLGHLGFLFLEFSQGKTQLSSMNANMPLFARVFSTILYQHGIEGVFTVQTLQNPLNNSNRNIFGGQVWDIGAGAIAWADICDLDFGLFLEVQEMIQEMPRKAATEPSGPRQ